MNNRLKSLIFMVLSTLSFAIMQAIVKYVQDIPVVEKVFFRNLISLIFALFVIRKSRFRIFGKKINQKFLFLRSTFGYIGLLLSFYAINYLTLADSAILTRLSPFFVTLFAALFLKEKITKVNLFCLIFALVGAIFVIKPKFDFSILPALAGFLTAIFAGGAYTVVSYLKTLEEPATIVFYFSLYSVLGSIPLMYGNFIVPNQKQLLLLILIGIFAAFGQILLTTAYKLTKASEVSIYNYTGIVFSVIIGFFIYNEVPDIYSVTGILIIVATALINFFYKEKNNN